MLAPRFALVLLPLGLAATPAFADQVIPVAPFQSLDLHGGVTADLKYGPAPKVTLITGSTEYTTIQVKNGTLDILGCNNWWRCPHQYDVRVEIVMPKVSSIEVHGGGELKSVNSFPKQRDLHISVHGGGDVDLRSLPGVNVTAEVYGGGDLETTAEQSLTGSVHGGGDLTYYGNPPKLQVSTHGGGDITHGS